MAVSFRETTALPCMGSRLLMLGTGCLLGSNDREITATLQCDSPVDWHQFRKAGTGHQELYSKVLD